MRVYRTNGNMGCIIGLLFLMLFFYTLVFFGRLLLTTPLGLAMVVTFGLWYWFEARSRKRQTHGGAYEFQGREPESREATPFSMMEDDGFNKADAVDVSFEEIKEDN